MKKCKKCGNTSEFVVINKSGICNICKAEQELKEKYGYYPPKLIPAGFQTYVEK